MQRPEEKDCTGPSPAEVAKCDPLVEIPPPPPPVGRFRRCLRDDQVVGDVEDTRFVDTKWIFNNDDLARIAPDHYLTTTQHFFPTPDACPKSGARRARLLWDYLLHRHALRVHQEATAAPVVEPYVTEYSETFSRDFTSALESDLVKPNENTIEEDAKHSLYEEPACSYWYQKQMLPPRGCCWDRVTPREDHDKLQPFRRNALFTTPVDASLYEPPVEASRFKPPRHTARVNHAMDHTPVM